MEAVKGALLPLVKGDRPATKTARQAGQRLEAVQGDRSSSLSVVPLVKGDRSTAA